MSCEGLSDAVNAGSNSLSFANGMPDGDQGVNCGSNRLT